MTPARDRMIRNKAQQVFDWATQEIQETEPLVEFKFPRTVPYIPGAFEVAYKAFTAQPHIQALHEYRSWLYQVQHYADSRRRHPIVRLVRRTRSLGRVERGEYGEPASRFHWHWQNLDEDRPAPDQSSTLASLPLPSLAHEGRAWFYWYVTPSSSKPLQLELDWAFGTFVHNTGISISRTRKGTLTVHVSIRPLFSVYVTVKHMLPQGENRSYSLSLYPQDMTLHYDFGKPGSGEIWTRDDPLNWMQGCRFLLDDIFGRSEFTKEKIGSPVQAIACLPEGKYTLALQREILTWKRPRWPWPYWRRSVDISLEQPPGFQGKGENSWDCGPDAIYGTSSPGHSYEDAVAKYVKAVLNERAKRGHLDPKHRTILTESEHDASLT